MHLNCNELKEEILNDYQQEYESIFREIKTTKIKKNSIDLLEFKKEISPTIYKRINSRGEPYYCINNFCGFNTKSLCEYSGKKLTDHEFDGNEIYICFGDSKDILAVLNVALIAIECWKYILNDKFHNENFDILMSLDEGKEFGVAPSATLRLYAIRDDYHFFAYDDIEECKCSILIEQLHSSKR